MADQSSIEKITHDLFQYLFNNKEEAINRLKNQQKVKEMLEQLLKGFDNININNYVNKMTIRGRKEHFEKLLRKIKVDISDSHYRRLLKQILKNLAQTMIKQQNPEDVINSLLRQKSSVRSLSSKDSQIFQNIQMGIQIQNFQEEDRAIYYESQMPAQQMLPDANLQNISEKDIIVKIRYFEKKMNFFYEYGDFSIENEIKIYIKNYLSKNDIKVGKNTTQLTILSDFMFIKSADAGNYSFDPFCDSLEIKLKRNDQKPFEKDIKIQGDLDQLQIESQNKICNKENERSYLSFSPQNSIKQLIEYLGEKRRILKQDIPVLVKVIQENGAACLIQDLFRWQKRQYENLRIKPTYIHQIQQMIQIIKDIKKQNSFQNKKRSQKQQECLRIGNSHKILRYLVYKNHGMQGVVKLPWLNIKNVRGAFNTLQIRNEQLLKELKDYYEGFALEAKQYEDPIQFSRGMILHGPPGTGKTQLSETLPRLMGFHLIDLGLSAADFMKSYVGQSSRMIRDLVKRASYTPYLLCSIAIDQVDGLVPDRKDKDEKNKGEGITMLLSVIGGNKDVSNLVFMTSTNYLKKIDEAIRRRFSGQFQVGRPNPNERRQIILNTVKYLSTQQKLLQSLIFMTINFTGSALKNVGKELNKKLRIKEMDELPIQLNQNQITEAAILIAHQFSIKLGVYTFPQICQAQQNKRNIITKNFLDKIADHLLFVQEINTNIKSVNSYKLIYANLTQKYINGRIEKFVERQEEEFHIFGYIVNNFKSFESELQKMFKNHTVYTIINTTSIEQIKEIIKQIPQENQKPVIFLVEDLMHNAQNAYNAYNAHNKYMGTVKMLQQSKKNIRIILYLSPYSDRQQRFNQIYPNQISSQNYEAQLNYEGRILVELNDYSRMAFSLKSINNDDQSSKVAFKLLLRSQNGTSHKDVIPDVVDFFIKQEVNYILLIDYQLLLENDAFDEKKMFQIIEQKMGQAKKYQKVGVIINADSLIALSENASDSSMGRSMSYSLVNHNMYQLLINYMNEFAFIDNNNKKWLAILARNQELIKKLKKDLNWPEHPQQAEEREKQEKKDKEKQCTRCGVIFTQRNNRQKKQRTCMQHPGRIMNLELGTLEQLPIKKLKDEILNKKIKQKQKQKEQKYAVQDNYIYTCCHKNIYQPGHKAYYHITKEQLQRGGDQLEKDIQDNFPEVEWMMINE